ncbi:MAG: type II CAAX endopeptidase family protein [Cyclobacteriaceae bacterium]
MDKKTNNAVISAKVVLLVEILFFLVWRFSGWAPRPIPIGNPLFLILVTASLFLPLSVDRRNWKSMGLFKGHVNSKIIGMGLVFGIALSILGFTLIIPGYEVLTDSQFDTSFFEQLRGNTTLLAAAIGISIVYAGFAEEMIYRGFIMNRIIDLFGGAKMAKILGVVGSVVIFAMAHSYQGIVGILSSGTVGLILALIYLKYGRNLWIVIITHATIDIVASILIYLSIF